MARVPPGDDRDLSAALGAGPAAGGRGGHGASVPQPKRRPARTGGARREARSPRRSRRPALARPTKRPPPRCVSAVRRGSSPVWRRQDSNLGRLSRQIYSGLSSLPTICGFPSTTNCRGTPGGKRVRLRARGGRMSAIAGVPAADSRTGVLPGHVSQRSVGRLAHCRVARSSIGSIHCHPCSALTGRSNSPGPWRTPPDGAALRLN
jgi:hypothetical protein